MYSNSLPVIRELAYRIAAAGAWVAVAEKVADGGGRGRYDALENPPGLHVDPKEVEAIVGPLDFGPRR